MEVRVRFDETSQPKIYTNVLNTYTKGDLFCIYTKDEKVHKLPIAKIFDIVEDYGYHAEGCMPPPPSEEAEDINNDPAGIL